MRLGLAHKGLLLVSAIIAVELTFLGYLYHFLGQTESTALRANDAKQIMGSTNRVWTNVFQCLAKAAYVSEHVEDKHAIRQFLNSCAPAYEAMDNLTSLLDQHSDQAYPKLRAVLSTGRKAIKALELVNSRLEKGNLIGAKMVADQLERRGMALHQLHFRLTVESNLARREQLQVLQDLKVAQSGSTSSLKWVLGGGIMANIVMAVLISVAFARGITARLRLLVENTNRLMEGRPLNPVLKDQDEIGHLDRVFHAMADTLTEAARKERAVIENARDVILVLDRQGLFRSVSPAARQVWGYDSGELTGRVASSLLLEANNQPWQEALNDAATMGQLSVENRVLRKDGSCADMRWSIRWSEEDAGFFCIAHDITERRKEEEALRASETTVRSIFDNMLVGLLIVTAQEAIELANSRAELMLGFGAGEMQGLELSQLFPSSLTDSSSVQPGPKTDDTAGFESAGNSGKPLGTAYSSGEEAPDGSQSSLVEKALNRVLEVMARTSDHQPLPLELSFTQFRSLQGERYLASLVDIAERYELEKMKQDFVAMISHDLRTPLASLQVYLDLLAAGTYGHLPEAARDASHSALRSVTQLLQLVNDLLDMAKLEAGRLELQIEEVSLMEMVQRSIEKATTIAGQERIRIESTGEDATVRVDEQRIERVLTNLILHAFKSSLPDCTIALTIEDADQQVAVRLDYPESTCPVEPPGTAAATSTESVESHAPAALFPSTGAALFSTTGKVADYLGLAICKALIEHHGGKIGAENGPGTTCSIWFQIAKAGKAKPSTATGVVE